jgi:hypothetical protein
MQNISHAVMAQRAEPRDSRDDFPTPPWATRGLIEHVLESRSALAQMSCLEPACGIGHMAKVLEEYFGEVRCSDAYDYGFEEVRDFLTFPFEINAVDWIITNPPFRLGGRLRVASASNSEPGCRDSCPDCFPRKCWTVRWHIQASSTHEVRSVCRARPDGEGPPRWQSNDSHGLCVVRLGKECGGNVAPYVDSTMPQAA